MAEKKAKATPLKELLEQDGGSILDDMMSTGIKPRDDAGKERGQLLIKNLVEQLLDPGMKVQKSVTKTIVARIAAIDELASYRDPVEIRAARIQTYLEWARTRNGRSSRVEARRAVNALLHLDPDHVEGLSLKRAIAMHWQARSGDLLVNSLSQTLVLVEPGTFEMGSPRTELFHQRSEQQHTVNLTRRFWIGRIEVTRGQFAEFVAAT